MTFILKTIKPELTALKSNSCLQSHRTGSDFDAPYCQSNKK